jgi:hypothetical protein
MSGTPIWILALVNMLVANAVVALMVVLGIP